MPDEALRVHDWDEWQSYRKDRAGPPPWIKIHRRITHNRKWARLTDAQKGQLLSIWIAAADDDGYIPNDPVLVRKMCGLDENPDLQVLVRLGFLDVTTTRQPNDNQMTTKRQPVVCLDTDTDTDTETHMSDFEEFWSAYAKKVHRKKAVEQYRKAVPKKLTHARLLEAVNAYRAAQPEAKFRADAFRWLRDERWTDQHAQPNRPPPLLQPFPDEYGAEA